MSLSNKKRKCDGGDLGGVELLDHHLIAKLDGLVDEIKSRFSTHRGKVPHSLQKVLDDDLNAVVESCEKFLKNSDSAAGEWLHDAIHEEPDVADVKNVINSYPNALVHVNQEGEIPIQTSCRKSQGFKYIAVLAEEASKREIGPERGGLLLPDPRRPSVNILQCLISSSKKNRSKNKEIEICNIRGLEALRSAELFTDKDFTRFNVLRCASHNLAPKRLEYLINLYPASLSTPLPHGDYPIHLSNYGINDKKDQLQTFTTFLKYGMKYHANKFGFLFKRNALGEIPIKQAIAAFGKKETLNIIQKAIPPSDNHPILHFVYRNTPSLTRDFVYRYPNAIHLKDRQGRHLLHIAVKRGLKLSEALLMMIHCDKKCLEEKDPVTNLYPFMLASTSGYPKDLTTIYNLLRYCPGVMSRCLDDDDIDIARE